MSSAEILSRYICDSEFIDDDVKKHWVYIFNQAAGQGFKLHFPAKQENLAKKVVEGLTTFMQCTGLECIYADLNRQGIKSVFFIAAKPVMIRPFYEAGVIIGFDSEETMRLQYDTTPVTELNAEIAAAIADIEL